jgi:hypothetical protein
LRFAKLLSDLPLVKSDFDARRGRAFFAFLGEESEYSPRTARNGHDHGQIVMVLQKLPNAAKHGARACVLTMPSL